MAVCCFAVSRGVSFDVAAQIISVSVKNVTIIIIWRCYGHAIKVPSVGKILLISASASDFSYWGVGIPVKNHQSALN